MGKRLIGVRRVHNLLERMPTSVEESVCAFRVDDHAEGVPRITYSPRTRLQFHARLEPRPSSAFPGHLNCFWILNRCNTDGSGLSQRLSPFVSRLVMRFERSGHVRRTSGHIHGNLAL